METTVRSNHPHMKDGLNPAFDVQAEMIRLKLPSAAPKDTIVKESKDLSKDDLANWKVLLDKLQSQKKQ